MITFLKNIFYPLLYGGQVSVNGSGFKNLNVWMTIEVGFQTSSHFSVSTILFKVQGLKKCYPLSLVGCHRIIRTGTETRVSEEFLLKIGIKGWQFEDPMWTHCRTASLAATLSCFLLINFFSFLFTPQSCPHFLPLTFTPFIIFSCPMHACMSFSRCVLLLFK